MLKAFGIDTEAGYYAWLELAIGAVLIAAVGLVLIKIALKITEKALKRSTLDGAMHKFILNVEKAVLITVLIVVLLGYLHVPTAPLVAVLGAGGAAIALALKDSLGNIAGGLLILANRPFKKGDVIDVGTTNGIVDSIDLFVTTLKTFDNKVVIIPNGFITSSVITNYSQEEFRRVDCVFGVGYDADIAKAKDVLLAVAEACPHVEKNLPPIVGVAEHQESSVAIDLKVWCRSEYYYDVRYFLEEQVKLAFEEADLTIPYPHVDVRVEK